MIQLPVIHLNGTDGHVLAAEYGNAIAVLDQAAAALEEITVHCRDYYLLSNTSSGTAAIVQHRVRIDRLREIQRELIQIHQHILDQLPTPQETTS